MKYLGWLFWCVVALLAALFSLPWVLIAIGAAVSGDDAAFERIMEASPFVSLLDWRDSR